MADGRGSCARRAQLGGADEDVLAAVRVRIRVVWGREDDCTAQCENCPPPFWRMSSYVVRRPDRLPVLAQQGRRALKMFEIVRDVLQAWRIRDITVRPLFLERSLRARRRGGRAWAGRPARLLAPALRRRVVQDACFLAFDVLMLGGDDLRPLRLAQELGGHYMDQFTYAELATDWRGNNNIA